MRQRIVVVARCIGREVGREHDRRRRTVVVDAPRDRRHAGWRFVEVVVRGPPRWLEPRRCRLVHAYLGRTPLARRSTIIAPFARRRTIIAPFVALALASTTVFLAALTIASAIGSAVASINARLIALTMTIVATVPPGALAIRARRSPGALSGARLSGARLSGARLSGVCLSG